MFQYSNIIIFVISDYKAIKYKLLRIVKIKVF